MSAILITVGLVILVCMTFSGEPELRTLAVLILFLMSLWWAFGDNIRNGWSEFSLKRREARHLREIKSHAARHNQVLILHHNRLGKQLEVVREQLEAARELRSKAGSAEVETLLDREIESISQSEADLNRRRKGFEAAMEKEFVAAKLESARRERNQTNEPALGLAEAAAAVSLQELNEQRTIGP